LALPRVRAIPTRLGNRRRAMRRWEGKEVDIVAAGASVCATRTDSSRDGCPSP